MTQKQALANLLVSIDWVPARYRLVCNWLEDMNWHGECGMLAGRLEPAHSKLLDLLQDFDYALRPTNYAHSFIQQLKSSHALDRFDAAVSDYNNCSFNGGLVVDNQLVGMDSVRSFHLAQDLYPAMSSIWGWGIVPSEWTSGGRGAPFVDELEALIQEPGPFTEG